MYTNYQLTNCKAKCQLMLETERTSNNSHPEGFHVYLVITLQVPCYVQAERSARLEQEGYDQVASLVVNEVSASGTR